MLWAIAVLLHLNNVQFKIQIRNFQRIISNPTINSRNAQRVLSIVLPVLRIHPKKHTQKESQNHDPKAHLTILLRKSAASILKTTKRTPPGRPEDM